MCRCLRRSRWLPALVAAIAPACGGAGDVDPALVGTWQLQWAGAPMYWDIRADGTYALTGAGGQPIHSGSFAAADGQWSLTSPVWGEDGGAYTLTDSNTFIGFGRLGQGTWVRTSGAAGGAVPQATGAPMQTEADGSRLLSRDLPELMRAATGRARAWRADATPVALEFEHVDASHYKGPEVKFSFYSPAEGTGLSLTYSTKEVRSFEFDQAVRWGTEPLPPVFVDLPAATRIAREDGLKGPVKRASLRVHSPGEAPSVLAWMLHTGGPDGGRTVDGATGDLIDYDVTGYIAAYNAQWEKAAQGLRALMRSSRGPSSSSSDFVIPGSGGDSSAPYVDPYDPEAYQKSVAEAAAYWGGNPDDYNRVKNGECTWSDSSNYGC